MNQKTGNDNNSLNVFGVGVTVLMEHVGLDDGYTVSKLECPPGVGAPLHRHVEREGFHVLKGEVLMEVGGREFLLRRGDFYQVESWEPHRFENSGKGPSIMLNFSIPSGHGKFFREADVLFRSNEFTPENAMKVCLANGIEVIVSDS